MSTQDRFAREQNRASILLAQLRSFLPRRRYECLLAMRRSIDFSRHWRAAEPGFESVWLDEVSAVLDRAFLALEKGNFGRSGYMRLGHLYRDYFFAVFGRAPEAISRRPSDP